MGRHKFNPDKDSPKFPRVREARQALLAEALNLIEIKKQIILDAMAAGEFEVADNAVNWLLSHMPSVDGMTAVSQDIDAHKQIEGPKGTQINIGFAIGGVTKPKELAPTTIDINPIESPDEE